MSAADLATLHERARDLHAAARALADDLTRAFHAAEPGSIRAWSLRGAEVQTQAATDLLWTATCTLHCERPSEVRDA